MRPRKVLALAALLHASLAVPAHSPTANSFNGFVPLSFESGIGDEHGNEAFIRIGSNVQCKVARSEALGPQPDSLAPLGRRHEAVYRYVYTFHNTGAHPIKINFSEAGIMRSPLFDVLQDFSVQLRGHDTEIVEFSTKAPPTTSSTPVTVAIWDTGARRWSFTPFGVASVYVPAGIDALASLGEAELAQLLLLCGG